MLIVFVFAASIAIMLYTQVPRYAFEAQRQKEELLVERGQEYQRAIQLYVRKLKKYPATLDDLEKTTNIRFLRRRYKDPMTNSDEWRIIHVAGGQLTDSLVKKPGANDPNKSTYQNTFITEGPSFGNANATNQGRVPPGGPLRQSDQQGAPGQMPAPGAPTGSGQQLAGNFTPGAGYQPAQPGQPQYPYPNQVQQYPNPNQPYQQPAYPGQINPITGAPQQVPLFPLVPGQQTIAGQPLPQRPYQPYLPPGQQGYTPGAVQPNTGFGQPPVVPTYPTSAANSQNSGFGSSGFGANPGTGQSQLGTPGGISGNAANLINDLLTKPRAGGFPGATTAGGQVMGAGIAGVASKYEGEGIKIYNESNLIQEWEFIYDPAKDKALNPAAATPGQSNANQQQNQQNQSPFGGNNSSPSSGQGGFGSGGGGFGAPPTPRQQ